MTKNIEARGVASRAKLGDAELVLLASGGQRADRLIEIPESLKPVTRQRAIANLIKRGLADERPARRRETPWREEDGARFVLAVTAAGLAAIGIEDSEPHIAARAEPAAADASVAGRQPLRPGSKGALLVAMLSRPAGASLEELIGATGWLPHTTRAALTGLRKRGFEVVRERAEDGSRYHIAATEPEPIPRQRRNRNRGAADQAAA